MDENDIIEMLNNISNGIDPSVDGKRNEKPSDYYSEIIKSLCLAVASLLSKHPVKDLKSTEYIKEAFTKYKDNIEKEKIFSAVEAANHDLREAAEKLGITYRKLESKIRYLGIGTEIAIDALWRNPEVEYLVIVRDIPLDKFLEKIEREIIYSALEETNFKKVKAAELLNISFRSLRYRVDNFGIEINPKLSSSREKRATEYFNFFGGLPLDDLIREIEKKTILEALDETNQNKTEAANKLGISFRSLRYRIKNLGI